MRNFSKAYCVSWIVNWSYYTCNYIKQWLGKTWYQHSCQQLGHWLSGYPKEIKKNKKLRPNCFKGFVKMKEVEKRIENIGWIFLYCTKDWGYLIGIMWTYRRRNPCNLKDNLLAFVMEFNQVALGRVKIKLKH